MRLPPATNSVAVLVRMTLNHEGSHKIKASLPVDLDSGFRPGFSNIFEGQRLC
jgi:hypothetical protein